MDNGSLSTMCIHILRTYQRKKGSYEKIPYSNTKKSYCQNRQIHKYMFFYSPENYELCRLDPLLCRRRYPINAYIKLRVAIVVPYFL